MALEYPESTWIAQQMRQVLPGRRVEKVVIRDQTSSVFRWGFTNVDRVDLSGKTILGIRQFGDYLFVEFDTHALTFGDMIGKILYHRSGEKRPPKASVVFELDDSSAFSYNPSLYGYCKAFTPEEIAHIQPPTWVQPLDETFTPEYLAQAFAEPERKIAKQMNVFNVKYKAAGVGIGYWQEILFRCGVSPQRKAAEISPGEFRQLHHETINVLRSAVEQHGSIDEVDFFGEKGLYVREMGGRHKGNPARCVERPFLGKTYWGQMFIFARLARNNLPSWRTS